MKEAKITWDISPNESLVSKIYYLSKNNKKISPWVRIVVYKSNNDASLDFAWIEYEGVISKPDFLNAYDYLWSLLHPEEVYMEILL